MGCPCCSKRKTKCFSQENSGRKSTLRTDNRKIESRPCPSKCKRTSKTCVRHYNSNSKHQSEEKKSYPRKSHSCCHRKRKSNCKLKVGTALGDDQNRSTRMCEFQRKKKSVLGHTVRATSTSLELSDNASSISETPLNVILDGQNIARFRHHNKSLSKLPHIRVQQLESALEYFERRKRKAAALLPWTTVALETESSKKSGHAADAATRERLLELHRQGKVFFTPEETHDDNFILAFGLRNKIPVISNDFYNGEVQKQTPKTKKWEMTSYLNKCCSPFNFDEKGKFVLKGELQGCTYPMM